MTEYVFTSRTFQGNLFFSFDDDRILVKFVNEAQLNDDQLAFLQRNFPFTEELLSKILGKHGKLEEIMDVSFEKFWTTYDKKVNKKRCEELWYKLPQNLRQLCLSKIQKYKNYCKMHNRVMKDPDTYLRNRSWEDEL
jgi:hypothetical protein